MAVSEQELMEMKLNTKITIGNVDIQRVVGGWIYWKRIGTIQTVSMGFAGVFVPENVSSPASIS